MTSRKVTLVYTLLIWSLRSFQQGAQLVMAFDLPTQGPEDILPMGSQPMAEQSGHGGQTCSWEAELCRGASEAHGPTLAIPKGTAG